jgi:NAD(P)-dependent dehydrogenase (short-subunit alcohol dehydrogenase family)
MNRFKGKTALITGGTTGLGLATAKLFIEEGARVIVTGRNPATIKAAQADLGDNAIVVPSDATSLPDMDALATKVKETFGKLDVLFVNAGYGHFMPFEEVTEAVYDEMLNLNAKGPYFIVQKLAPLMPKGSSVVFTTSIANVKGGADFERLWRRQSSASCNDTEHCCRVVAPWNTCECGDPRSYWIDGHNA